MEAKERNDGLVIVLDPDFSPVAALRTTEKKCHIGAKTETLKTSHMNLNLYAVFFTNTFTGKLPVNHEPFRTLCSKMTQSGRRNLSFIHTVFFFLSLAIVFSSCGLGCPN